MDATAQEDVVDPKRPTLVQLRRLEEQLRVAVDARRSLLETLRQDGHKGQGEVDHLQSVLADRRSVARNVAATCLVHVRDHLKENVPVWRAGGEYGTDERIGHWSITWKGADACRLYGAANQSDSHGGRAGGHVVPLACNENGANKRVLVVDVNVKKTDLVHASSNVKETGTNEDHEMAMDVYSGAHCLLRTVYVAFLTKEVKEGSKENETVQPPSEGVCCMCTCVAHAGALGAGIDGALRLMVPMTAQSCWVRVVGAGLVCVSGVAPDAYAVKAAPCRYHVVQRKRRVRHASEESLPDDDNLYTVAREWQNMLGGVAKPVTMSDAIALFEDYARMRHIVVHDGCEAGIQRKVERDACGMDGHDEWEEFEAQTVVGSTVSGLDALHEANRHDRGQGGHDEAIAHAVAGEVELALKRGRTVKCDALLRGAVCRFEDAVKMHNEARDAGTVIIGTKGRSIVYARIKGCPVRLVMHPARSSQVAEGDQPAVTGTIERLIMLERQLEMSQLAEKRHRDHQRHKDRQRHGRRGRHVLMNNLEPHGHDMHIHLSGTHQHGSHTGKKKGVNSDGGDHHSSTSRRSPDRQRKCEEDSQHGTVQSHGGGHSAPRLVVGSGLSLRHMLPSILHRSYDMYIRLDDVVALLEGTVLHKVTLSPVPTVLALAPAAAKPTASVQASWPMTTSIVMGGTIAPPKAGALPIQATVDRSLHRHALAEALDAAKRRHGLAHLLATDVRTALTLIGESLARDGALRHSRSGDACLTNTPCAKLDASCHGHTMCRKTLTAALGPVSRSVSVHPQVRPGLLHVGPPQMGPPIGRPRGLAASTAM